MNLRQLYYFKAIAELEHYTRAAEKLYVSQSSLSHAIQELEDELNVEFFVKRGRNVELTKYGQLFLPYVQKTLETLETGIATLADCINPNTGTVIMAGLPSLAQFAPDIIVRYVSETNRVDVRLQFNQGATYFHLRELLLDGAADLVFSSAIDDPRVGSTYIGVHPLVLLVPQGHRLARQECADLRELDGEDFISFDPSCQLRGVTEQIFQSLNIHPNITAETEQDAIINGLVAANHGVAIIPYPLGGIPYNTKVVRISNDIPPRKLYLMWNKEQYLPPAAEYFRDFIIRSGEVFTQFLMKNHPNFNWE